MRPKKKWPTSYLLKKFKETLPTSFLKTGIKCAVDDNTSLYDFGFDEITEDYATSPY